MILKPFIAEKGYMTAGEIKETYINLTKTAEEKEKEQKKSEQRKPTAWKKNVRNGKNKSVRKEEFP